MLLGHFLEGVLKKCMGTKKKHGFCLTQSYETEYTCKFKVIYQGMLKNLSGKNSFFLLWDIIASLWIKGR